MDNEIIAVSVCGGEKIFASNIDISDNEFDSETAYCKLDGILVSYT